MAKAGFGVKEVEHVFDKLWSEGLDIDDTELAVKSIISFLRVVHLLHAES